MPPSRALKLRTAALGVQPQGHHSKVAAKESQLKPTSSTQRFGLQQAPEAHQLLLKCGTAPVLGSDTYSAGHRHHPARGESNHASPEDTHSAVLGLDTETQCI